MQKPKKTSWKTDGWFVTDGTSLFRISDLKALCKAGDEELRIYLEFVNFTVVTKTKKDRDEIYNFLHKFWKTYIAAQQKHSAQHHDQFGKMVKFAEKACKHG